MHRSSGFVCKYYWACLTSGGHGHDFFFVMILKGLLGCLYQHQALCNKTLCSCTHHEFHWNYVEGWINSLLCFDTEMVNKGYT